MAFLRKTISQDELKSKLPASEQEAGPTYQASRGGWFAKAEKPVPGTPKNDRKNGGRS
ncbi:hypothetical protein ACFVZR_38295 [Streptomyces sp. NPDC058316]|uniref:hypothetical protein n=1 Tax=Streptomyces sp. NPDC058316 TaxID=3346442 RepID=UPI0036E42B89